jgi:hypothetical protein
MRNKIKLLEFGKKNKNKTVVNGLSVNGFSPMTLEVHLGEWSPIASNCSATDSIPLMTGTSYVESFSGGINMPKDDRLLGILLPEEKWLDKTNPEDVIIYLKGSCRCAPEFQIKEKPNGEKEYRLVGVSII